MSNGGWGDWAPGGEPTIATLEEDTDAPDDGKVLIAGVLYDAVTGEEVDDGECEHTTAERDDDGLGRHFYTCVDCGEEVVLTAPDEDGITSWEVIS